jgi:hypothetical protein
MSTPPFNLHGVLLGAGSLWPPLAPQKGPEKYSFLKLSPKNWLAIQLKRNYKILDRWEVLSFKETPGTKSDCGPLYGKECNQNGAHQIQQKKSYRNISIAAPTNKS